MKLELKHLAAYLPYNLQMTRNGFIGTLTSLRTCGSIRVSCSDWVENINDINTYLPILRPLSDLTYEIEIGGKRVIPINEIELEGAEIYISYGYIRIIQKNDYDFIHYIDVHKNITEFILSLHFDVFGLIDKGLAIDINTLK